jgi:hypothetical protein
LEKEKLSVSKYLSEATEENQNKNQINLSEGIRYAEQDSNRPPPVIQAGVTTQKTSESPPQWKPKK